MGDDAEGLQGAPAPEGLSDLGGIRTMGAKSETGTLPPGER